MNLSIARISDSLILSKYEKIAKALCKVNWQVSVSGGNWELFNVTSTPSELNPWAKNGVAKKMIDGSGVGGVAFTLIVDGRHIVQIHRQNDLFSDRLTIEQSWYGGNEDSSKLAYTIAADLIGAEFMATRFTEGVSPAVSSELGRFVECRDEGLAKLEELYVRFTRQLLEDRESDAREVRLKKEKLEEDAQKLRNSIEQESQSAKKALKIKEDALVERLKDVDNRESKFVRRDIRNQLKQEIKSRQAKFELTLGTQRMRWPIIIASTVLAVILGYGFYYYTLEIIRELAASKPPEGFVLAIMLTRQVLIGLGLGGIAWFFIHWQNAWSQRHADEEFAVKRLELDLDRASWVVELAMEWSKEKNGQELPDSILTELTKNLFNDRESVSKPSPRPDVVSALLDASTTAEVAVGDMKFSLDRKAAKKLKEALSE